MIKNTTDEPSPKNTIKTRNAAWVARRLNTSWNTVARLIDEGQIKAYKLRDGDGGKKGASSPFTAVKLALLSLQLNSPILQFNSPITPA